MYYCKDTLFEAIHNSLEATASLSTVVCITAKIHFLKQFTTLTSDYADYSCCLYYCKDTLFEAIHNAVGEVVYTLTVVCITAKIHFLSESQRSF